MLTGKKKKAVLIARILGVNAKLCPQVAHAHKEVE